MRILLNFLLFAIIGCNVNSGTIQRTVTFTWTAPGDDSTVGTASRYDGRYALTSDSLIMNWRNCRQWQNIFIKQPNIAGTPESLTSIIDVVIGRTIYFGIAAGDEIQQWRIDSLLSMGTSIDSIRATNPDSLEYYGRNWSPISNIVKATWWDIFSPSTIINFKVIKK